MHSEEEKQEEEVIPEEAKETISADHSKAKENEYWNEYLRKIKSDQH